jgi:hypothetical protein
MTKENEKYKKAIKSASYVEEVNYNNAPIMAVTQIVQLLYI